MSKYSPLGEYLRKQWTREVPMTFAEIERVIGDTLPPKAQQHRAWWSNSPSNNVMTKVWLDAGYRSEQVDMSSRKLVFRRVADAPKASSRGIGDPSRAFKAEERAAPTPRRHPLFGALKGTVKIMPGVDLTEPAMPEWADFIDEKYGKGPKPE